MNMNMSINDYKEKYLKLKKIKNKKDDYLNELIETNIALKQQYNTNSINLVNKLIEAQILNKTITVNTKIVNDIPRQTFVPIIKPSERLFWGGNILKEETENNIFSEHKQKINELKSELDNFRI